MICDPKPPNRTVIGVRYTIYDQIGAGGMAAVHIGSLQGAAGFARTVAFERLHPALAHHEALVESSVGKPAVRQVTSPRRATSPFSDLGGRL